MQNHAILVLLAASLLYNLQCEDDYQKLHYKLSKNHNQKITKVNDSSNVNQHPKWRFDTCQCQTVMSMNRSCYIIDTLAYIDCCTTALVTKLDKNEAMECL